MTTTREAMKLIHRTARIYRREAPWRAPLLIGVVQGRCTVWHREPGDQATVSAELAARKAAHLTVFDDRAAVGPVGFPMLRALSQYASAALLCSCQPLPTEIAEAVELAEQHGWLFLIETRPSAAPLWVQAVAGQMPIATLRIDETGQRRSETIYPVEQRIENG